MNTYATRDEAVTREIIEPLGEYANGHDTDAIAEEVIVTTGDLGKAVDHLKSQNNGTQKD